MKQLIDFPILIIQPLDTKSAMDLFKCNINDVSSQLRKAQITDKCIKKQLAFLFFYYRL